MGRYYVSNVPPEDADTPEAVNDYYDDVESYYDEIDDRRGEG